MYTCIYVYTYIHVYHNALYKILSCILYINDNNIIVIIYIYTIYIILYCNIIEYYIGITF